MQIIANSHFKNPALDLAFFKKWIDKLEQLNGYEYEKIQIRTSLGKTQVYGINIANSMLETIVIFPGFRTTSLIWDLEGNLQKLGKSFRVFMVETNGQPNLSDGNSPAIKSLDYGHWANEVFNELKIDKAYVVGASFGGLVCAKLSATNPERIKAIFMLNAGCLQPFSLSLPNLYYNLLPVVNPNKKNVSKFLNRVIFSKPNHQIIDKSEALLNEYLLFCLKRFKDNTQKPYYMHSELTKVQNKVYLLQGDQDLLFPIKKSISNAKIHFSNLMDVKIFTDVGHGIETFKPAILYIKKTIEKQ